MSPSLTLTGGSSLIARSMSERTSGSSSAFSTSTSISEASKPLSTSRIAGTWLSERSIATRSRGVAEPRLIRPTTRSRSETSLSSARSLSRRTCDANRSCTAAILASTSPRLTHGRSNQARSRRPPMPVTVSSITCNNERPLPPASDSTSSRLRTVTLSRTR